MEEERISIISWFPGNNPTTTLGSAIIFQMKVCLNLLVNVEWVPPNWFEVQGPNFHSAGKREGIHEYYMHSARLVMLVTVKTREPLVHKWMDLKCLLSRQRFILYLRILFHAEEPFDSVWWWAESTWSIWAEISSTVTYCTYVVRTSQPTGIHSGRQASLPGPFQISTQATIIELGGQWQQQLTKADSYILGALASVVCHLFGGVCPTTVRRLQCVCMKQVKFGSPIIISLYVYLLTSQMVSDGHGQINTVHRALLRTSPWCQ